MRDGLAARGASPRSDLHGRLHRARPLEPRAAVAEWNDGKLTVWTGTQRPFAVRDELTQAFHIPERQRARNRARYRLRPTAASTPAKRRGSGAAGAGRRQAGESCCGRARRNSPGRISGRPASSRSRAASPPTARSPRGNFTITIPVRRRFATLVQNSEPAHRISPGRIRRCARARIAGWRPAANHFARESHMDELAHARHGSAGISHEKYCGSPTCAMCLQAAAKSFGWPGKKTSREPDSALPAAIEKGGYVATCAEVAIDGSRGGVRVVRLVDCVRLRRNR